MNFKRLKGERFATRTLAQMRYLSSRSRKAQFDQLDSLRSGTLRPGVIRSSHLVENSATAGSSSISIIPDEDCASVYSETQPTVFRQFCRW